MSTLLSSTVVASTLFFGGAGTVNAAGVSIDSANFPDAVFRDYVKTHFDVNGNSVLDAEEAENAQIISMFGDDYEELESVQGIKYFTNLITLDVSFTNITSIDVSGMQNIESVIASYSENCSSVNITNCPNLYAIHIASTNVKTLDVSGCPELGFFSLSLNPQLTLPDFSLCKKTDVLLVDNCHLASLDLSKTPNLYHLEADGNNFATLDIGPCEMLQYAIKGEKKIDEYGYDSRNKEFHTRIVYKNLDDKTGSTAQLTVDPYCEVKIDKTTAVKPEGTPPAANTPAPTTSSAPTSGPRPTVGAIPTAAPTEAAKMNVGDFVNRCYKVALGRNADDEGFSYWKDKLVDGAACGAQVGYGFIFSGEYIGKNKSNEDYVKDLYDMFFGRKPDEAGFNGWLSQLNDGTDREVVFAGFANSEEFYNLCKDYGVVSGYYAVGVDCDRQGGVNCFVARLYKTCLNRLPDQGSQAGWVQKLLANETTGSSIAYSFTFSPEFVQMNLSKEEFVAYMYRAFFGREADQDGFEGWVNKMIDGASEEDVFNGFTGSIEFDALCQSYGITR